MCVCVCVGGGCPGKQGVACSGHMSKPPTLSLGQPVPRLARCSRVSVSSSHAHRATASSPPRTGRRTSSCTCLSESLPAPRSRLGPATGSQQCLQNASLGLCPHWLKSVVLAAFFAPRAFRGSGGGGLGPGGEGEPQKPWDPLPESWILFPHHGGLGGWASPWAFQPGGGLGEAGWSWSGPQPSCQAWPVESLSPEPWGPP